MEIFASTFVCPTALHQVVYLTVWKNRVDTWLRKVEVAHPKLDVEEGKDLNIQVLKLSSIHILYN